MSGGAEQHSRVNAVLRDGPTWAAQMHPRLLQVLRKRLAGRRRDDLDAEDLLQESLVAALRHLAGTRVESAEGLANYVLAIARRRMIDASRRRRNPSSLEHAPIALDPRPELGDGMIEAEQSLELRQTLARLRRHYRWALHLRTYVGVRWEVVQLALGCETEHAARCTLSRARAELTRSV